MKIICIGRNYAKHARELGNSLPTEPVIFMKPDSAVMRQRDKFYIPDFTNDIHYEAEIVIRINRLGKRIQGKFAHKYFAEYTLGIDFTARDLQKQLKASGLPWEKAKGFDQSAALGDWKSVENVAMDNIEFELKKNGESVQKGNSADMIFAIPEIIEYVSSYFTLKIGDLIFTGTPEGVGPISAQDVLEGFIGSEKVFHLQVR